MNLIEIMSNCINFLTYCIHDTGSHPILAFSGFNFDATHDLSTVVSLTTAMIHCAWVYVLKCHHVALLYLLKAKTFVWFLFLKV